MSIQNEYVIEIENLSKSFAEKKVIQSISLKIPTGQVIGYLGLNGAGKSTTVKILTGLIEDFYGTVKVCGFDIREDSIAIKKRIGYVPETAELYETLSPLEYILFIGRIHHLDDKEIEQRAVDMLSILGLQNEIHNPMTTFSKGMKQKVLITASIIHNPDVIFLDEPMSGLDASSVILLKEIISQLAQRGKTIFYCSHMMDVVERVCDRIVILSQGKIVADGSFADLQNIKQEKSLEEIFTQLTGEVNNKEKAEKYINSLFATRN
jgi:ABC-2 type transport system ATP-binding protein